MFFKLSNSMHAVVRSTFDVDADGFHLHSLADLATQLFTVLDRIPDRIWVNYNRKNVRSLEQTHADQLLLGLYSGVQSRGRLQFTKNTFRFPGLTRLVIRMLQFTPQFADMPFTSIQINRNVRTIPHRDSNNFGPSIGWAVGDWTGGELFIMDARGSFTYEVNDLNCPVAARGDKLLGRLLDVRQLCCFDGNVVHATMPFTGDRIMMVFFCVKQHIPVSPQASCLSFARFLGLRVPVLSSSSSSLPFVVLPSSSLLSLPAPSPLFCVASSSSSSAVLRSSSSASPVPRPSSRPLLSSPLSPVSSVASLASSSLSALLPPASPPSSCSSCGFSSPPSCRSFSCSSGMSLDVAEDEDSSDISWEP